MSEMFDRRRFLEVAAATGATALTAASAHAAQPAAGEKVVLGVMGTGGRGTELSQTFAKIPGVEVAYVCDVDQKRVANAAEKVGKITGKPPQAVEDFRKILDDKAVHALVVATCNHWHAPAAILACAAGKHVYVEKPCSHNAREGELLVEAARKNHRLVQMGNQRRSRSHFQEAIQALKEGVIGRAYLAQAWYNNGRPSIGTGKDVPPPSGLNYDLWQGPAPRRPFKSNILHYNWHWFWHWGNGELGNNGIHTIDVCRWGLGVEYPVRVTSAGGRYAWQDDQQTPDTNVVTFDFGERKSIVWHGVSCNKHGSRAGAEVAFYGDNGSLAIDGKGYTVFDKNDKEVKQVKSRDNDSVHMANFVDAVRSNKPLNSEIEEGHKSTLLCHLGNIAYRTGHTLHTDAKNGHILHDQQASAQWSREYEKGWEPKV